MIKYKGICQFCFKKIPPGLATREHIVRIADGGRPAGENITLACKLCNYKNEEIQALLAKIPKWIQECIERQTKGLSVAVEGAGNPKFMAPTYPEMIRKQIRATLIRQKKNAPIAGATPKYLNSSSVQNKKEREWC